MDTMTTAGMPGYASMAFDELAAHKKALDAAYAVKKTEAQAAFFDRFRKEAEEMGFDIGTIGNGKAAKAPRRAKGGSPAPVRYQDPANPANTWSGRGKPKKWLQELIDAGKDKEDYKVA